MEHTAFKLQIPNINKIEIPFDESSSLENLQKFLSSDEEQCEPSQLNKLEEVKNEVIRVEQDPAKKSSKNVIKD